MNTDPPNSPASTPPTTKNTIKINDTLIIQLPSGETRTIVLKDASTRISLGKFGTFSQGDLLGHPFGLDYEILGGSGGKIAVRPPQSMVEIEDTSATNELINDGAFVQPLTFVEIEALKNTPGVHSSEIIKAQIEQNANYSLKTEYSKDKYKKRKEAKFLQGFKVIQPTIFNICEYWFAKDLVKSKSIRPDSLSQMMNMGGVRSGGRYIVVDDAGGIVVAGVLDRIGDKGKVLAITDAESPPSFPVVSLMNISAKTYNEMVVSLNWAHVDPDYIPIEPSAEPPAGEAYRSDKQRIRLERRKIASQQFHALRNEYFAGEWDGLLVSTDYEPYSVVEKVFPYLAGSASVVVHSPYMQILVDAYQKMKKDTKYLGPSLTESWLRQYQVLPGRTHPMMNTSGSGGYLLSAIKVYDDVETNSIMASKYELRRLKRATARIAAQAKEQEDAEKSDQEGDDDGEMDVDKMLMI